MYVNQATVAVSPKEGFIRFQLVIPNFDDKNEVSGAKVDESIDIVMSREVLESLSTLIANVLKDNNSVQEK